MKTRPRVFVTDGSYPNGLAAVRALDQSGYRVTAGERESVSLSRSISFWSRHCSERLRYPDPKLLPDTCAVALAEHFRRKAYEAAIPVGLDMVEFFLRYRDRLPAPMMLPPHESFLIASDKRLTFECAAGTAVPIPRTVAASDWSQLQLPLVFKHHRTGAVVAHTQEEATALVHRLGPELHTFIAQEYIPGRNGFGYFALFQEGREIGYFMHERVMQFPQEGGVSVVARAIRNDRLRDLGRRLLESLAWNGPAMVEFKRSDRDGEFYLIEINPKLWGSLDLAIQAGCNFPVWIANLLCTGKAPQEPAYMEGVTYQWVVPNGLKCFLRYPEFRTQFLSNLTKAKVHTDLRWLDPLPAIAGVLAMTAGLGRK